MEDKKGILSSQGRKDKSKGYRVSWGHERVKYIG